MNRCIRCNQETRNPKFCSRSCATTFNNIKSPKRALGGRCMVCDLPIQKGRMFCDTHYAEHRQAKDYTLGEIRQRYKLSSAYAIVRNRARIALADVRSCQRCGYNKHVEICHIKPIASYSDETRISEINVAHNLIALCPNCHWELDNP